MLDFHVLQELRTAEGGKIVLLVLDGLGGLPMTPGGPTALEAAGTPNLDRLAAGGITGLHEPVGPGITPGSGPGHLSLFGYDPLRYRIGRGVLEALGIGFDLRADDLAARGNFCTVDDEGIVTDRRAGRISTEKAVELCAELREIRLPGVELFVEPVKEHRFMLALRGEGLAEGVADTDPEETGRAPLEVRAERPEAERAADLVQTFVREARNRLADHHPANMVLLRGFAKRPDWPRFPELFGLRAAALAQYPMYRGVARLVGMDAPEVGATHEDLFDALEAAWSAHDFVFAHVKATDKAGEDGDFERKVAVIEEIDGFIPRIEALAPAVILVTGDHSTPAALRSHSWHPVPVLLWSGTCRPDAVSRFGERWCREGALGLRRAHDLMTLAMAHAHRLMKFGA